MGIEIRIYLKSLEPSLVRFVTYFFDVFNIKDYRVHESMHRGGVYYRFWLFGIDFTLCDNWDLDAQGSYDDDFQDYTYYFEFSHDWTPVGCNEAIIQEMLAHWFAQLIAFTLEVETAYKLETDGQEQSEIRMFKKNPDYQKDKFIENKGIPALLADQRIGHSSM